jgi:AraC-like DNA-binding protein
MLLLSNYRFSLSHQWLRPLLNWRSPGPSQLQVVRAQQFKERIHSHLEHNFGNCEYNVERLSADMGMSRSQLFRKCKQTLKLSPVVLIKQYRLEKSRSFLKSGIYNVSEAAYLAGFNSLSYYSKSFKKVYGETPSRFIA